MRNMGMLVPIAFIVIPAIVSAETWKAHTTLETEKSMWGQNCPQMAISYTLDLTDNTFTATSQHGKMFTTTTSANGEIKKSYRRVQDTGFLTLEMTGNVKSRELDVVVVGSGCHYKLTPDS